MKTDRRRVLQGAMGLGATAAWPLQAGAPSDLSRADWPAVRQLFRLQGEAPLNAANLCPAYTAVLDGQHDHAGRLNADVGFLNRRDFVRHELDAARRACARMLGLKERHSLALLRNTTEANAVIVNGLDLKAEDEVLLWRENHATNYRSWHYRHLREPFQVRVIDMPSAPQRVDEIVEVWLAALRPKTRVVSFSHLSNISGRLLPARAICQAIHDQRPDIFIHIDGAQSWGSLQLDLDAMGCDSYAASGHKWLCGPRGTGVLMLRRKWIEQVRPLMLGYDVHFDYPQMSLQDDARRYENLGQRDTAALAALGIAVSNHETIGMARIESRIQALTAHAINAFDQAGIACITPADSRFGHAVVVADLGSTLRSYGAFLALHNAGYAAAFIHGNRVHCSPQGELHEEDSPVYLRLCPHIYNSTEDIDAAVAIARRIRDSSFEILKELVRFL